MTERCCGTEPRIIRNEYDNNACAFVCPVCNFGVRGSIQFWNDRIREREAAKFLIAEPDTCDSCGNPLDVSGQEVSCPTCERIAAVDSDPEPWGGTWCDQL